MLQLHIRGTDESGVVLFDEANNKFISAKSQTIELEHSLLAISAWESKWKVPFLGDDRSGEQLLDYIRCMTLTPDVDPNLYRCITPKEIAQVQAYINDPHTATWFNDKDTKPNHKVITAERLYSWMVQLNIPFECASWHLSNLLILIRACNELNNPPEKMSRSATAAYYKQQRAARRKAHSRR